MDPVTGAEQIIEGAFAYYNGPCPIIGRLCDFSASRSPRYNLVILILQNTKDTGSRARCATPSSTHGRARRAGASTIRSIPQSSGRLAGVLIARRLSIRTMANL